jgi:cell division septation protein DedD
LIGKRILVPAKTFSNIEVVSNEVVPVPVAPKFSTPSPKVEKTEYPNLNAVPEAKKPEVRIKKKIILPVSAVKKVNAADDPAVKDDAFYKVEAGLFSSKAGAIEKMKELEEQGFEVFAKEASAGSWRVQAGAFKTRDKAEKVIADLKAKGFSGKIIKE